MFNDFEIFKLLYTNQSINQVAKMLGYSQSNISVRLQVLESEFKSQFFIRSSRGLQPTQAGQIFFKYVNHVLAQTSEVRATLAQPVETQLMVISELLFRYFVLTLKTYTLKQYTYAIQSSTQIVTKADLENADLVLTYANFNDDCYEQIKAGSLETQLAYKRGANVAQLPFLVNSDQQCPFRQQTLTLIKDSPIEINSWDGIIELVRQGKGQALLPQFIIDQEKFNSDSPFSIHPVRYQLFQKTAKNGL